jgi:hypothetical protein
LVLERFWREKGEGMEQREEKLREKSGDLEKRRGERIKGILG